MQELAVPTRSRVQLVDITSHVQAALAQEGITDGVCHVAVPHTTAGVTLNENADPDVTADIIAVLDGLVPRRDDYRHGEGNSPAHIKTALMRSSETLLVEGGRLVLGTWQAIFFCEFDGPRSRTLLVRLMADKG